MDGKEINNTVMINRIPLEIVQVLVFFFNNDKLNMARSVVVTSVLGIVF